MATNYDLASIGFALDTSYNLSLSGYNLAQGSFLTIKKRNDLGVYNNSIIWPLKDDTDLVAIGGLSSLPTLPFTRSSSATRVNSKGFIEVVDNNVPRFDYDPITLQPKGILIENTKGNFIRNSNTLNDWATTSSTVSSNAAIAPDGTNTAIKLIPNSGVSSRKGITNSPNIASSSTGYIFSVYAKPAGFNTITVFDNNGGALSLPGLGTGGGFYAFNAQINLNTYAVTGDTGSVAGILVQPAGNGWVRCSLRYSGTARNPTITIGHPDGIVGNGVDGVYLWGAQLETIGDTYENNLYPTSLITTAGASATRSFDQIRMTSQSLSSFFNANNGTWLVEWSVPGLPPSFARLISFNIQPDTILGYNNTTQIGTYNGLNQSSNITTNNTLTGVPNKAAITYTTTGSLSGYSMVLNGGPVLNSTFAPFGETINQIFIGGTFDNNKGNLNGWVRQVEYFNITVPDSTLQALTLSA
jgi:hypothetical protein